MTAAAAVAASQAAPAPAGVRQVSCPLCWARPAEPCQQYYPPGNHMARWLAACAAGRVTRSQLAAVIGRLTVVTRRVIVPDLAPRRLPALQDKNTALRRAGA